MGSRTVTASYKLGPTTTTCSSEWKQDNLTLLGTAKTAGVRGSVSPRDIDDKIIVEEFPDNAPVKDKSPFRDFGEIGDS